MPVIKFDIKKLGFTLAEVLITLGIIGVVAAMTMPTLMNTTKNKELEAQLKKTYSELNQISRRFYYENDISFPEFAASSGDVQEIARTFMSYYNGGQKVSDHTYMEDISEAPYPLTLLSGAPTDTILCDDGGYHTEISGKIFLFNNPPRGLVNGPVMCVDINGYKAPNKFGHDYFAFVFTTDGFVVPMGQEHRSHIRLEEDEEVDWQNNFFAEGPEYCSKDGTTALSNASCAYYALQNVSPENDGETYWSDFLKR